jgi:8-amino-7-oxononanoate synthase
MTVNQSFDNHLKKLLSEKETQGLLRRLVSVTDKIDFCSNDYLGFAAKTAFINASSVDNTLPMGSTGSRLITGNSNLAEETEAMLAQFHKAEAALIYSSGFMANLGLFSCIAAKGDTILSDQYIHASIIDGIRLSKANRNWFKHNDLEDLELKLQKATNQIFVVVESIYSMDGDEAPICQIADLCAKYNALLMVDEAHSTGIYGERGEGLVCQYQLEDKVYARIHTFGKALGAHGAVIVGSTILRNYLINYSRSFIYTTGAPPAFYAQIQRIYALLPEANRTHLFELIAYFNIQSQKLSNIQRVESLSPIQAFIIGDNFKAKNIENQLLTKGFFVKAILSPTVPVGTERLRISIHAFNTKAEIDDLLSAIESVDKKVTIQLEHIGT